MNTFDVYANNSFAWKWKLPEEQDQYIHYTAPTYGVDANQTFDYAGLLVFTDANVTRVYRECYAFLDVLKWRGRTYVP